MNQMDVISPPSPTEVVFSGDRSDFRRLVMRGGFLEFVTVGFYRFWLTTDIRRHLWSHTGIDDDAVEYTGRARELLIGFLIALAILVPIYLAYFITALEIERMRALGSIPFFLFFYVFGQFAIYRARRYRLTRTVWRGVRFWMSGSGWAYALRASLWGALTVLTLGLMLPWREAALERYKMRHSFYGDLQGRFEGTGWEFFKRGWWLWLLAIASLVIWPLGPFVYAAFKATEWRWWVSGIRFGDVNFKSDLSRSALLSIHWKVVGWLLLLVVIFVIYLIGCAALMGTVSKVPAEDLFSGKGAAGSIGFLVLQAIGYLVVMVAMTVVTRIYLLRDVWACVAASTSVQSIDAAYHVLAAGELASAVGEGLADGLDVAGF